MKLVKHLVLFLFVCTAEVSNFILLSPTLLQSKMAAQLRPEAYLFHFWYERALNVPFFCF